MSIDEYGQFKRKQSRKNGPSLSNDLSSEEQGVSLWEQILLSILSFFKKSGFYARIEQLVYIIFWYIFIGYITPAMTSNIWVACLLIPFLFAIWGCINLLIAMGFYKIFENIIRRFFQRRRINPSITNLIRTGSAALSVKDTIIKFFKRKAFYARLEQLFICAVWVLFIYYVKSVFSSPIDWDSIRFLPFSFLFLITGPILFLAIIDWCVMLTRVIIPNKIGRYIFYIFIAAVIGMCML